MNNPSQFRLEKIGSVQARPEVARQIGRSKASRKAESYEVEAEYRAPALKRSRVAQRRKGRVIWAPSCRWLQKETSQGMRRIDFNYEKSSATIARGPNNIAQLR